MSLDKKTTLVNPVYTAYRAAYRGAHHASAVAAAAAKAAADDAYTAANAVAHAADSAAFAAIAKLTEERDEARREVCVAESRGTRFRTAREHADRMGWDCFKEKTP